MRLITPPPPGAYIPGDADVEACGALRPCPTSRIPVPIKVAPFPVDNNILGE